MEITVHTDGGSRGNPGEGAVGVSIKYQVSSIKCQVSGIKKKEERKIKIAKRIGICTNNEAEYMAVVEALQNLKSQISNLKSTNKNEKITIQFYLDSSLVCNQLCGLFKVKEPRMREFVVRIRQLEAELGIYPTYHLIPREENKEADQLVNQALDQL